MKCTFREVMAVATRARINGVDWVVVPGDVTVVLRRPSADPDPRVSFVEMKFSGAQEVHLRDSCVTAFRSDSKAGERVRMWLLREVPITAADIVQAASARDHERCE